MEVDESSSCPSALREKVTVGGAARAIAVILLVATCILLNDPIALNLFSIDGESFSPSLAAFLGKLRLGLGATALALLWISVGAPRLSARRLPLRRGHVALTVVALVICLIGG